VEDLIGETALVALRRVSEGVSRAGAGEVRHAGRGHRGRRDGADGLVEGLPAAVRDAREDVRGEAGLAASERGGSTVRWWPCSPTAGTATASAPSTTRGWPAFR